VLTTFIFILSKTFIFLKNNEQNNNKHNNFIECFFKNKNKKQGLI